VDSFDNDLALRLDVVPVDCIIRTLEEQVDSCLDKDCYCENREKVVSAGIRRRCCRRS
jgi:hypothetical protein